MAPKHYDNMQDASLSEYITADTARLVPEPLRGISAGYTEIPLEIQLRSQTRKKLSFPVAWDGVLSGFVRGKEQLRQKLGFTLPLQSVTLSDWDEGFVLIFETANADQTAAFRVREEDVLDMLEHCKRPPDMAKEI